MDSEAAAIIESYESELSGFIRSRVARSEDAEDILQDVWLGFSRTLRQSDIGQPAAWLYRAARNRIIDQYRRRSTDWLEEYLDEDADGVWIDAEDPESLLYQEEFWEAFYEAVDSLPEKQRLVFLLNELEGITLREIAERQGEPLKTIISRKGYAVRQLRERLVDLLEM